MDWPCGPSLERGMGRPAAPAGCFLFSLRGLKRLRNSSEKGSVLEWLRGRFGYLMVFVSDRLWEVREGEVERQHVLFFEFL